MEIGELKEKTVLEIDDVEYIITPTSLIAIKKNTEVIPVFRLFDYKEFFITR